MVLVKMNSTMLDSLMIVVKVTQSPLVMTMLTVDTVIDSGGAAVSPETVRYFLSLDMKVLSGYISFRWPESRLIFPAA